jgi:rRNA maturation RNase YbeY
MITVDVSKQSSYPVSVKKIKETVVETLEKNGITSDFLVEVSIVGTQTMLEIGDKYYKEEEKGIEHPIFTFPTHETKKPFLTPPGEPESLGDIYISYPFAVQTAKNEDKTPEQVIIELVEHGCLHLLGIHH